MESIARYLNLTFETRVIEGLKAKFKGPGKHKGSSKSASAKKGKSKTAAATEAARNKDRLRDRKNIGKRRAPSSVKAQEAGHAPLTRRARGDSKPDSD
jgi:hypothetical protein